MSDRSAVGPACISRAIERAVTDRRPSARYLAPFRAVLMMAFVRRMPTRWADFVSGAPLASGLTSPEPSLARPAPRHRTAGLAGGREVTDARAALRLALAARARRLPSLVPAAELGGRWRRLGDAFRNDAGIQVSRKVVAGSPFVAFRGEGDVDAPLLAVADVLVDVPHENQWLDSVKEARILRKVSDTEYIMYSHLGTPPTMTDRDFVTDVTVAIDPTQARPHGRRCSRSTTPRRRIPTTSARSSPRTARFTLRREPRRTARAPTSSRRFTATRRGASRAGP